MAFTITSSSVPSYLQTPMSLQLHTRVQAVLGIGLFTFFSWLLASQLTQQSNPVPARYTGAAAPKWNVGHLDTVLMHVQNTVHYQLNGSLADAQWASLIPRGGGSIYLGTEREPFMLSMYHQLRCLDIIRQAYIQAADGHHDLQQAGEHCLNYIRQMVLCRGDLRLERVVDPYGPHAVQVRETTTCQDWTAVYNKVNAMYEKT